ncbi:MAG: R.Pab1 family restriction endonuclease [Helicobacteraceae bacterium]|jgi:hypothetical protein|nr:R.Pab1 family restriction endonuclease [Helicobacteraceae bacterium]
MQIDAHSQKLHVELPLTSSTGKVRIKRRNMLYEYGLPIKTKSEPFMMTDYVEWQIGYDAVVNDQDKIELTSLRGCIFTGANGKVKALYELSEYIYYLAKWNIISKPDIISIEDDINSIDNDNLLENKLKIKRSNPTLENINNILFEKSTVEYPLLIHKFSDCEITVEIITKEKQSAVGVMSMLYLCFPITKLQSEVPLLGRTAKTKESAFFIIDENNAIVFIRMIKLFGMLSRAHKHDILAILKTIKVRI